MEAHRDTVHKYRGQGSMRLSLCSAGADVTPQTAIPLLTTQSIRIAMTESI